MSAAASLGVQTRRRLRGFYGESLLRTGHLLVANAVFNAGFGVLYWLLAARFYAPAVMAVNSAAISAMMLLAGAAQLNLMSALLRFVPTSGAAAGRMIRRGYLVGGTLSGVVAFVFVQGLHVWAPDGLEDMLRPGYPAISFVVATILWSIFVMQDNALVAVGRPGGVPAENTSFAVLKIVLIAVFAFGAASHTGIWWSWTAAMAVCVGGTSVYLFGRAVPAFVRAHAHEQAEVVTLRDLRRFVGPDYVGALAWIACTSLVPLLVLDLAGARHAAAFALPWSMCIALYSVPNAFGQSLVAHSVRNQDLLEVNYRRAVKHTLTLLTPVVALVVAFAPIGLRLFGPYYAEHSTATLRLLSLSAFPNTVVTLSVAKARVARRMATVVGTLVGLSVLVLGLVYVLVPKMGVVGAAVAWLTGQCVVASVLLLRNHVPKIRLKLVRSARGGVPAQVVRTAMANGVWEQEKALRTASDTAVVMVKVAEGTPGVLKVAASDSGMDSLRREVEVLSRLSSDERLGAWRSLLPVPWQAGGVGGGGAFLLTNRLPGRTLHPGMARRVTASAFYAISPLHNLDRGVRYADDAMLRCWVDDPVAEIARAVPETAGLERMAAGLHDYLAGRLVTLGWTHGDFYSGNVLAGPDGLVTGIVDWSQAREQDLLALDLVFWLLTVPGPGHGYPRSFGARVAAGLRQPWTMAESGLIGTVIDGDPVSQRVLLLLAWLRHVAGNLDKSDRYADSVLWSRRNITPVLKAVARD
jgi:O-antigen/teichoic acid export membrane protein